MGRKGEGQRGLGRGEVADVFTVSGRCVKANIF